MEKPRLESNPWPTDTPPQRDKLWQTSPFPCVGSFKFVELALSSHPQYAALLSAIKAGAYTLDIGCCVGQDLRRFVADGADSANLAGTDLQADFLDLGYELFLDRHTWKGTMVAADLFDEDDAKLGVFEGKCDVVLAQSVFHLFQVEKQRVLARRVLGFLRDKKGVMVMGRQGSFVTAREFSLGDQRLFWHDDASWRRLWDETGREIRDEKGNEMKFDVQTWMVKDESWFWEGCKVPNWEEGRVLYFTIKRI